MNRRNIRNLSIALTLAFSSPSVAQEATTQAAPAQPRTITRLFWQDSDTNSIRWSNLQKGTDWSLKGAEVAAFPKLDKEQCSLVQMEEAEGVLLAGVRDQEDGSVQSGWVAIDSGVAQEAHGDHFHWKFAAEPKVKTTKLDDTQPIGRPMGWLSKLLGLWPGNTETAQLQNSRSAAKLRRTTGSASTSKNGAGCRTYLRHTHAGDELGMMFAHGNSPGAAFCLLILGTGLNFATIVWLVQNYGRKATTFWLWALLTIVVACGYAVERPLIPPGI